MEAGGDAPPTWIEGRRRTFSPEAASVQGVREVRLRTPGHFLKRGLKTRLGVDKRGASSCYDVEEPPTTLQSLTPCASYPSPTALPVPPSSSSAPMATSLLVVFSVVIASAGQAGQQAVAALRQAAQSVGRASSCVEGLNSVVRMQQSRHRKMTQELLDLKRQYWNLRTFRTGRRQKTSTYQRLGVTLPSNLSWWQLLQLTPDQLRALLSAQAGAI